MEISFFFLFLSLLFSASGCSTCVHQSKASHSGSSSTLSGGACGYGSIGADISGGYAASGSSALFRDGVGCGACFLIRCKNKGLCSKSGVKVVLTGLNRSHETDFALSSKAFAKMANKGMTQNVMELGVVDIEFKRIPCEYKNQNLSIRVEEKSKKPNHLTIKFLYQGGQTDIVGVDVATAGKSNWRFMTRDYGSVWSTNRAPTGPLQFRMVVGSGFDGKWIWAHGEVLPAQWRAGVLYDSGVQINDVAHQGCFPCDNSQWS